MEVEKKIRTVVPGEEIAYEKNGFMGGLGTFSEGGVIASCLSGVVNTINKLITVVPQKHPYKPEVGDVLIGRVISVDKKSWRLDVNSQRDANLSLTSINLPKGEQRRRSENDAMQMRNYFEENDLISGEVQQTHPDGGVNVQTRNLKYGKLKNGILVEVKHNLIKKMKHHFIDLIKDIKAIVGRNGWIWIYFSTVKLGNEYFTDDQNKINAMNKHETVTEYAAINIILFKNIIKSLENNSVSIDQVSITKFYEYYIQLLEQIKANDPSNVKLTELEFLKNNIVISKIIEIKVITDLKAYLSANTKNQIIVDLGKELDTINKMIVDTPMEYDEDEEMDR